MMPRSFFKYIWCSLGLLITSGLVLSCVPEQSVVSCAEIQQDALRSLAYGNATKPQALTWIMDNYQLENATITEEDGRLRWLYGNSGYVATFEHGTLKRVGIDWRKGYEPTVQEVLTCLGPPDYYTAALKPDQEVRFELSLWYLDEGLVVNSVSFSRNEPVKPVVREDRRVTHMVVLQPGSIVDLIMRVYGYSSVADVPDTLLSTLKPWPGDLSQIVIENLLPQ